ncbi:hypothetical protein QM008_05925 [Bifidobacterium angulatum]|uniref:arsenate reductase/protein-tyrosine-phosphatase family protein n=1 Tax=Bifidobacterium angulatum TaxID=1683 RepID=UPI00406C3B5A
MPLVHRFSVPVFFRLFPTPCSWHVDRLELFVCTGNISRSPMAEILTPHIFNEPSLEFSSAGTHGLHDYAISREAERLLQRSHISQMTVDAFRSRRLTADIAAAVA